MDDNFKISAQIIEFFWFFICLIFLIFAIYIKFKVKKEIHSEDQILNSNGPDKKYQAPPQGNQDDQNGNIIIKNDDISNSGQLQSSQPTKPSQTTILEDWNLKFLKMGNHALPNFGVVIICIINQASYIFALVWTIIYLILITLFQGCSIQQRIQNTTIKNILTLVSDFWLLAFYINYFVCQLL